MTGVERIAAERRRQFEQEGWSAAHDDKHSDGSLALAGAAYAVHTVWPDHAVGLWPWDEPDMKEDCSAIRCLEKAGALIAAEIDRLRRKCE